MAVATPIQIRFERFDGALGIAPAPAELLLLASGVLAALVHRRRDGVRESRAR